MRGSKVGTGDTYILLTRTVVRKHKFDLSFDRFWPGFRPKLARECYQRPRLEKCSLNHRKLARATKDSKVGQVILILYVLRAPDLYLLRPPITPLTTDLGPCNPTYNPAYILASVAGR